MREHVGRRACVALQPDMEMATACAKPSHLAASSRPCLNASGYTCVQGAEPTRLVVNFLAAVHGQHHCRYEGPNAASLLFHFFVTVRN